MSFLYVPPALVITSVAFYPLWKCIIHWLRENSWPLWMNMAIAIPGSVLALVAMICAAAAIKVFLDEIDAKARRLYSTRK